MTEETVQRWIENEKSVITSKDVHCPVAGWRMTSFLMLHAIILSHTVLQLYYIVIITR